MILLDLVQGSKEWLEARMKYFTASEAPAMMGAHKNISRTNLLDHKKGWTTIVNDYTLRLFEKGHQTEEMARPLAGQIIGEGFNPAVGVDEDGVYLASFDGITLLEDVLFEHKLYNKVLAENVLNNVLEPHYYWQLEHQLLVSGAEKVLFVTSDGTPDNFQHMFYESVPERREQLIKGWVQFAEDLEAHEPQAKAEQVKAADLVKTETTSPQLIPALAVEATGLVSHSNLHSFAEKVAEFLNGINDSPETDSQFGEAEQQVKYIKSVENKIAEVEKSIKDGTQDITNALDTLKAVKKSLAEKRLFLDKQVKTRKEEIKQEIFEAAQKTIGDKEKWAEEATGAICPRTTADVIEAMKGKRNIDSLQDAADSEVAKAKIEINGFVEVAEQNKALLSQHPGHKFLFNDWSQIAFKAPEDFRALVTARIAEYEQQKAAELEAERSRIRAEEEAKAMREAEEKARQEQAQRDAELKAQREAELKTQQSNPATADMAEQAAREDEDEKPETQTAKAAEPVAISHSGSKATAPRKLALMEVNAVVNFIAWAKVEDKSIADTLDNLYSQYLEQREAV